MDGWQGGQGVRCQQGTRRQSQRGSACARVCKCTQPPNEPRPGALLYMHHNALLVINSYIRTTVTQQACPQVTHPADLRPLALAAAEW
jgi:hypothetical protein